MEGVSNARLSKLTPIRMITTPFPEDYVPGGFKSEVVGMRGVITIACMDEESRMMSQMALLCVCTSATEGGAATLQYILDGKLAVTRMETETLRVSMDRTKDTSNATLLFLAWFGAKEECWQG